MPYLYLRQKGGIDALVRDCGDGPFGNIMDIYKLTCGGGQPATAEVYMDMYHGGFMELRAAPRFNVAP